MGCRAELGFVATSGFTKGRKPRPHFRAASAAPFRLPASYTAWTRYSSRIRFSSSRRRVPDHLTLSSTSCLKSAPPSAQKLRPAWLDNWTIASSRRRVLPAGCLSDRHPGSSCSPQIIRSNRTDAAAVNWCWGGTGHQGACTEISARDAVEGCVGWGGQMADESQCLDRCIEVFARTGWRSLTL